MPLARPAQAAEAKPAIVGVWETIDDRTQTKKSLVELTWDGATLSGRVVALLDPKADTKATCQACSGPQHGQPIVGMTIMWGLASSDGGRRLWERGTVLDPANGKEYRCRLRLLDDGRLEVRGYVGLPLLGRSQLWQRRASPAAADRS